MNSFENKNRKVKSQELFSQYVGKEKVMYIEREVEKFDFEGYEIVPREMFSQRRTVCRT